MSDLSCAATLVVARHGDTEYLDPRFSDEGGSLSAAGRVQARALGERLAGRRIARVWTSDTSRAVQTAEIAAAHLGVDVRTCAALREVGIGSLLGRPFSVAAIDAVTDRWFDGDLDAGFEDGESGLDVVARYAAQLTAIADEHRGETVLVVAHETAACIALPCLAGNVRPTYAEHRELRIGQCAELLLDDDGARLLRWGDRRW